MSNNNTEVTTRAALGRIGSPLAGGIFSGVVPFEGGLAALVLSPKEFGEREASLADTSIPGMDSTWVLPTRDEMELLVAIWRGRKAPVDVSWYEGDPVAFEMYSSRTTELGQSAWYLTTTRVESHPSQFWAVYAGDGDVSPISRDESVSVRLIRRIPIMG